METTNEQRGRRYIRGFEPRRRHCNYGEKCNRKDAPHLNQFIHTHLTEILKRTNGSVRIPEDYECQTDPATLLIQLQILSEPSSQSQTASNSTNWRKPDSSSSYQHNNPSSWRIKSNNTNSEPKNEPPTVDGPSWKDYIEKLKVKASSIVKIPLNEKMEAAHPYNIFFSTIADLPETHTDLLSITFTELLSPYFGELERSLHMNCGVDLYFLLSQYEITGHRSKDMTLVYMNVDNGEAELKSNKFKNITYKKVLTPTYQGSHHSKLMVFQYTNKSVRLVITSGNLQRADWENVTQGLWISPECPALGEDASSEEAGESVTHFKRDLLEYLTFFRYPCLQPWIDLLSRVDMSAVKVFFVGFVPGAHTEKKDRWAQMRLANLLREHITTDSGQVIAQTSAFSRLGEDPDAWLRSELLMTLSQSKNVPPELPPLKIIYPTKETVLKCIGGVDNAYCLCYAPSNRKQQPWMTSFLCDWKCDKFHRSRCVSHTKSYCRISDDQRKLHYFFLTSANVSQAGWGVQERCGLLLSVASYEIGVLFIPQILVGGDYFPLTKEDDEGAKPFPLPFDLPLVPYQESDSPWVSAPLQNIKKY